MIMIGIHPPPASVPRAVEEKEGRCAALGYFNSELFL